MREEDLKYCETLMSRRDHGMLFALASEKNALYQELADQVPGLVGEVRRLHLEIELWKEYHAFALGVNEGAIALASLHGWSCPTEAYLKGVEYRKKLRILKETEKRAQKPPDTHE